MPDSSQTSFRRGLVLADLSLHSYHVKVVSPRMTQCQLHAEEIPHFTQISQFRLPTTRTHLKINIYFQQVQP